MAKTLTERIKIQLANEGLELRSRKARKWLRAKMLELKGVATSPLLSDPKRSRLKRNDVFGNRYFFGRFSRCCMVVVSSCREVSG